MEPSSPGPETRRARETWAEIKHPGTARGGGERHLLAAAGQTAMGVHGQQVGLHQGMALYHKPLSSRSASCHLAVGYMGLLPRFGNFFAICLWDIRDSPGWGNQAAGGQGQGQPWQESPSGHQCILFRNRPVVIQPVVIQPMASLRLKGKCCGWHLLVGGCRCTCRCHAQAVILFTALHQKCY